MFTCFTLVSGLILHALKNFVVSLLFCGISRRWLAFVSSPDIIRWGWLSSKYQLTKLLQCFTDTWDDPVASNPIDIRSKTADDTQVTLLHTWSSYLTLDSNGHSSLLTLRFIAFDYTATCYAQTLRQSFLWLDFYTSRGDSITLPAVPIPYGGWGGG